MGTTRIDYVSIVPIYSEDPSGIVIVGGDSALSTDSLDSYVDWDSRLVTGSGTKGLRLYLPSGVEFPTTGFTTLMWRAKPLGEGLFGDWEEELNPFDGVNGGYNINLRAIQAGLTDGSRSWEDMAELHSDMRIDNGVARTFSPSVPLDWSLVSPIPHEMLNTASELWVGIHFASLPGHRYFNYRIYEAWLEISDGASEDTGSPGPSQISLATNGYYGEGVYHSGQEPWPEGYPEAEVATGIRFNGVSNSDPWGIGYWADGSQLIIDWNYNVRVMRKDGFGPRLMSYVPRYFNNGWDPALLIDRVNKCVWNFFFDDDSSGDGTGRLTLEAYSPSGVITRSLVTTPDSNPWPYDSPLDWEVFPATGGVYGNTLTYAGNLGDPNSANGSITFFVENLVRIDLVTGQRELIGAMTTGPELDALPFSWLLGSFRPGAWAPDDAGSWMTAMAVDPRDGSYWFLYRIDGYYWDGQQSWYDPGPLYVDAPHILHTDAEGNEIDRFRFYTGTESSIISCGGIQVDGNGIVYFWASLSAMKRPVDHGEIWDLDDDEYDAVWFFDPVTTDEYTHLRIDRHLYFNTGIWAIETNLLIPADTGIPPLRHKQRNDGIGVSEGHARLNSRGSSNNASSLQHGKRILKNTFKGYR